MRMNIDWVVWDTWLVLYPPVTHLKIAMTICNIYLLGSPALFYDWTFIYISQREQQLHSSYR